MEYLAYAAFFMTLAMTYSIICLGLNVQWGQTGLFNVGVAAFVGVGAYTSVLLTTPPTPDRIGGFGLPIARDMAQKVILVGSNDLQSLYVANNVCSAVEYFRKLGGNVGVAGLVINKDDGTGEAQAFAEAVDIPVLTAIPADEDIRRKSANYQIIGKPGGEWAGLFEELAKNVAEAPPQQPKPLDQDGLLDLFSPEETGGNVELVPATQADMRGGVFEEKPSLEVIYDEV